MNRLDTYTTTTFENWTVHCPVPFDRVEKNPLSEREIQILAYDKENVVGALRIALCDLKGSDIYLVSRIW